MGPPKAGADRDDDKNFCRLESDVNKRSDSLAGKYYRLTNFLYLMSDKEMLCEMTQACAGLFEW